MRSERHRTNHARTLAAATLRSSRGLELFAVGGVLFYVLQHEARVQM